MAASALRLGCRRSVIGRVPRRLFSSLSLNGWDHRNSLKYDIWRDRNAKAATTARLNRGFASLSSEKESGAAMESVAIKEPSMDFIPEKVMQDLATSAKWNQGYGDGNNEKWDPDFCRRAVNQYERHLVYVLNQLEQVDKDAPLDDIVAPEFVEQTQQLLSADTADLAMKAVVKTKLPPTALSRRVRNLERLIGSIGRTPLTDRLSLRLVEANGKAGNIGRVLSLLNLRGSRGFEPDSREFVHAVTSLDSAGLFLRTARNILFADAYQPTIDNPTRWLDAILINMHKRNAPLTTKMANRMLNTYATTGKTSKALHFFYFISRHPVLDPETLEPVPLDDPDHSDMPKFEDRRVRVRLKWKAPPGYYKVPSESRGKLVAIPRERERRRKLDRESDPDWSVPLTAAFAFADSLTHGACGHAPIKLDRVSYNTLIKICCYRGSLWRAMQLLERTMPQQGIEPDTFSYNTILAGLARVGDTVIMKEMFVTMNNKSVPLDKYTIEAMVDGMLNMGDISGAITFVQDVFNQHGVLPPYTTHLKIIEFALASDLVYEAKRHIYLLQQIWKWEPNKYHSPEQIRLMEQTKHNPKLSKGSLQKLFAYFGERLHESDFF